MSGSNHDHQLPRILSSPQMFNQHPGITSSSDGLLHGSPQSMYAQLPRRASEVNFVHTADHRATTEEADEVKAARKRKRASMPSIPTSNAVIGSSQGRLGSNLGSEDEETEAKKGKSRSTSHGGVPNLTSCEACRKGKRRCEPSPLVPPNHPDVAKLPCARCRRFALECVRVKVARRKGPAPVDLSAISDATHGYRPPSARGSFDGSNLDPNSAVRRSSSGQTLAPELVDYNYSAQTQQRSMSYPSPIPLLAVSPVMSHASSMPDNLDQVVSGPVIDNIIGLFFDYVYPLTPCLHRPTFIANLTARRDKTDPVFFALALTVIASTLVQVPRSLVHLEKNEIENLARRCVRVARAKTTFIWEEPGPLNSSYIVISYLEGIVHLFLGNNTAHVISTAQANQLALAMRLNEETSYDNLDPIECEMRRRMYWLLFQADKSTACLRARTINLRLEDAANLRLPTEVDDEQITPNGILPQPFGKTPLISGFNINTNLFRILNDALLLQRRRSSPTVDSVLADLQNVHELREKIMQTTLSVATPLQLRKAFDSRVSSPALDWESKLQERFVEFFQSPQGTTHALNSFLVMQGNILVTQHLVRIVLLQTRESLFQQLSVLTQMPIQSVGTMAGVPNVEAAEDIACELLDGLNSLPVECVATNGPSLVQKVRFVAIQLMECSSKSSASTSRAQKLLMQFLSVLSVIEGMYTFGRDISAE